MEKQTTNILFNKTSENIEYGITKIPKEWLLKIGINEDCPEAALYFDDSRIIIEYPEMSDIKKVPLASNKKIHNFAMIWMQMYKNYKTTPFYYFEDNSFIGEGMAALGFEMDCGNSLEAAFPNSNALNDNEALKRIMPLIDIQLLGNAIFSQWRYYNHWAMAPMEDKNFLWFVLAFERLAELTK